jgi:hypothetical protein
VIRLLLAGCVTLVVAAPSWAQVESFDWTLHYQPFQGTADQQPGGFHITGPNNDDRASGPGQTTWVAAVAPVDGHVDVAVDFVNLDSEWAFDAPASFLNSVMTLPAGGTYPTGGYAFSFDVSAGDEFGFGIWSADAAFGPGVGDFHDFVFTPDTWHDAGHALDPREGLTVSPPAGTTDFGAAVAAIGDLDGDLKPDVAVGAPASSRVLVVSSVDGAVLLDIAGGAGFGSVVAAAGDVNGDLAPDILVGMPLADGPAGEDAGRVEVRSGADGSLLFAVDGEAPHAALGTSVAPARDVTGDGLADVIVGAPRTFPATAPGYALLLAGPAGALIQRFDGDTDQDRFGSAVSGLGDADGDGVRDVVVSAPGWFPSTAYVESGATGATLATATHPDAAFTIATSLAPLGDVDGDARPDFVWGLPAVDVFNSGYVSVVSGASGAILKTLAGQSFFDVLGGAVAGGDFDGDGTPDIAFQSRHVDGDAGRVRIASGASGFQVVHELTAGLTDRFGQSLSAAGGIDGDGATDLVLGAPGGLGLRLLRALDGHGVPSLSGSGDLSPGSPFGIALADARGHAPVVIVASLVRVDLPAQGGVLVPFPTSLFPVFTNASGAFTASSTWPAAIPSGITLWMQAWISDVDGPFGFAASNGLGGETP